MLILVYLEIGHMAGVLWDIESLLCSGAEQSTAVNSCILLDLVEGRRILI